MSPAVSAFPRDMKVFIAPGADRLLPAAGIADYASIMFADLEYVTGHAGRSVHRLAFTLDGADRTLFVKRFFPKPGLKGLVQRVTKREGGAARARLEARFIDAFNDAGLGTARYLAWGTRGFLGKREGFIVIEGLDDYTPLEELLSGLPRDGPGASARAELARLLGRYVRRMHTAGFYLPDLYAKHVFVRGEALSRELALIDLQRARKARRLAERTRARDLAALDASLPENLVSSTDRMRFLHEYFGASELTPDRKRFVRAVIAGSVRIARRRRFRRWRARTTPVGSSHRDDPQPV